MLGDQWGGYGEDGPERRESGQHRRPRRGLLRRWPLVGIGVTGAGLAAVVLAVTVSLGQVTGSTACAAELSPGQAAGSGQIATHYVLTGLPNCSYQNPPADQLFVALSPSEYNSAGGCGGYLEVHGPDGSVRVKVIDQCPECATGHIDLSEAAFAKLAPLSAGLINISYTYLANPALPGPISIEVKDGSSQYWLALLADNTGNPLASVQVRTSSGWQSLSRASYNYWIAQGGSGSGPFTVRLTDIQGNTTTVSGIRLSPGSVQSTGTYMYGAGSAPAPVTQAPTTPAATTSSAAPSATASASRSSPSRSPSPSSSRKRAKATPSPSHAGKSPTPNKDPQAAPGGPLATEPAQSPSPRATC
jgi:expansin (peptidoglycan-binding protein)